MSGYKITKLEREQISIARSLCDDAGQTLTIINGHPKRLKIGPYKLQIMSSSKDFRVLCNLETNVRHVLRSLAG